jgi:hypothetical protein
MLPQQEQQLLNFAVGLVEMHRMTIDLLMILTAVLNYNARIPRRYSGIA